MWPANPLTSGFWTTSTFLYCYSFHCRHLVVPFKLCAGLPLCSLDPLRPVISKTVAIFFLKGKCACVPSLPKNHSVSLVRHLFGMFPTPSIFLVTGLWENLAELPVALQSIKLCRAFIPSTWNLPPPALFCWDLVEISLYDAFSRTHSMTWSHLSPHHHSVILCFQNNECFQSNVLWCADYKFIYPTIL